MFVQRRRIPIDIQRCIHEEAVKFHIHMDCFGFKSVQNAIALPSCLCRVICVVATRSWNLPLNFLCFITMINQWIAWGVLLLQFYQDSISGEWAHVHDYVNFTKCKATATRNRRACTILMWLRSEYHMRELRFGESEISWSTYTTPCPQVVSRRTTNQLYVQIYPFD